MIIFMILSSSDNMIYYSFNLILKIRINNSLLA